MHISAPHVPVRHQHYVVLLSYVPDSLKVSGTLAIGTLMSSPA